MMDIPDYSSNVERIVLSDFICRYVIELINKLDVKQALEGFSIRNADGETVDYVMFEDK